MKRHYSTILVMFATLCASVVAAQAVPAENSLPATRRAPDEFGTQDYTVTTISATSFTADTPYATDYGSLFRQFPDNTDGHFFVGVSIPSGAVIDFIGLESSNTGPDLVATLFYADRYSGTTSGIVSVAGTSHPSPNTDYNPAALGYQLVRNVHNELVLDVHQNSVASSTHFGWVEIWWKRTVSPAPATATFSDVPTSDSAFQFIEALAASGITIGCGGGNYCPDAPLTRRQMAVFLSKGLGLRWPY
ncbi:MAG: S-layer homology domain-containing protein [Thermoanaerobaculia bacterium]